MERVQECKEKWRNLRTVFIRRMKPSPRGYLGGKKKAYYLENAMQFCVPFIKSVIPPAKENLPSPSCTTQPSTDDNEGSELDDESANASQNYPSIAPSILDYPPQQQTENPPESLSSKSAGTSQIQKKTNRSSASVADQSVADYWYSKTKKAKMISNAEATDTSNQKIDRQQGIKMFLLSLIPELEELSDSQIKLFKRQVLRVIDDISALDHHQQPWSSSALTVLASPTISESGDSHFQCT
ncbi:uncharacterized protein LOC111060055 isoform X2 [Nilaparvata lugens]|uniref:uncharacterized protein LOC111060055 isoform X2 n=1 Tax=Nilaparvata lugens TaxID=108931 RepID=UPI00193DCEED|nr:uncharacterized protein LOC111060055 isoform X2 [Nilaparvata lugens]